jgi:site-specific DNA recombinase
LQPCYGRDDMSTTVIYRRQSRDRNQDELAVERQLRVCQRVADSREWPVAQVITDNDLSASKRGRSGYARLVQLIEAGAVHRVIILRIDRLLRLNDELEELIALVETRGLSVITAEGDINLGTPQGRLMARVLVSVARSEIEVKSARHKLANQQRAEAGLPHKGRRAFGYASDGLTVNEDEALALKQIAQKFISGWSYDDLAQWLNDNGYRTCMGNEFVGVAIRQMLMRHRYAGLRHYEGQLYPAQWPAIFDDATWQHLQYVIRQRTETYDKPAARKYLLTGLIRCGVCGAPMNGSMNYDNRSGEARKTYRCNRERLGAAGHPGCGRVSRQAAPVEHLLRELLVARLDTPDLGRLLSDGSDSGILSELLAKREALQTRKNGLVDDYADGTLDKTAYKRAVSRVEAALRAVQVDVDQLSTPRLSGLLSAGESVREAWELQTDGWRRSLLDLLVESVTVMPGRSLPIYEADGRRYKFAPELIDVRWKA